MLCVLSAAFEYEHGDVRLSLSVSRRLNSPVDCPRDQNGRLSTLTLLSRFAREGRLPCELLEYAKVMKPMNKCSEVKVPCGLKGCGLVSISVISPVP